MKALKSLITGIAATAIAVTGTALIASPAQAANNTETMARTICDNQAPGSGYNVQDKAGVVYDIPGGAGDHRATTYLLYSSGSGYNCAVTLKDDDMTSASHYTKVELASYKSGRVFARKTDAEVYQYYAGAVWLYAPGQCVSVVGQVGQSTNAAYGYVPIGHCG